MPSVIPRLDNERLERQVVELGQRVRQRRKAMGVPVVAAAEAAGMSRVTWHRIEKGEISVTIGAWFNALSVIGLAFGLGEATAMPPPGEAPASAAGIRDGERGELQLPVEIRLGDYPQLQALAWQVTGIDTLHPREALGIYQRNRRHINWDAIRPHERRLVDALEAVFEAPDSV